MSRELHLLFWSLAVLSLLAVPKASAEPIFEIDGTYGGISTPQGNNASTFTLVLGMTTNPLAGKALNDLVVDLDMTVAGVVRFGIAGDETTSLQIGPGESSMSLSLVRFLLPSDLNGNPPGTLDPPQPDQPSVITVSLPLAFVDQTLIDAGFDFAPLENAILVFSISGIMFDRPSRDGPGGPYVASWNTNDTPVTASFIIVPAAVPEPATLTLAVSGLFGLAGVGWLKRRGPGAPTRNFLASA
jgi:hypothetical protein